MSTAEESVVRQGLWRNLKSARGQHPLHNGRPDTESPADLENAHAFGPELAYAALSFLSR